MEPNLESTRQLHTRFGKLLGYAGPKFSPTQLSNNPSAYLPPLIASSANIKSIEVTTDMEGDLPVYSYHVSWLQKAEPDAKTTKANISSSSEKKTKRKPKSTKDEDADDNEPIPLVKKTSSVLRISGKVRCEGPCGLFTDAATTVQFGCDHLICEKCRKSALSAALFDGSPGCCNATCVQIARVNGDKICAGPSDSTQSLLSVRRIWVVYSNVECARRRHFCDIVLRLSDTYGNGGQNVLRTQLDFEFSSSARLSALVATLRHYKDLIEHSRYYYSVRKPRSRSDLHPISLCDTNLRFHDLSDSKASPDLYFMIVGQGIQFLS
uniref:Uncharacterized protein n=1 Tax=Caenorhabditis japonica TaxID=281687 RepID=A0A8R1EBU6_CAEJA